MNIIGNIIGSGTALTNLNYNSILNPPTIPNFNNPCTLTSSLFVSGNTALQNATTCAATLTIASTTIVGNNNSNRNLQLGSVNGNNYSIASPAGAFSGYAILRAQTHADEGNSQCRLNASLNASSGV